MELILNSIVLVLLCLAIAYCWKLNGKIQHLQNSRGDIKSLINSLDSSINTASNSISDLKILTNKTMVEMSDYIKQSEELSNDLSFLIEKATKLADELESNIQTTSKLNNNNKYTTTKKNTATKSVKKKKQKKDLNN